jgi:transposase
MHAYSLDLRTRVLNAIDAGQTTADVAERFAVSTAWVRRLTQRRRLTGEIAPRVRRARPPKLLPHHPTIRELLDRTPDLTLEELRGELGVEVALSTLWYAVRNLGYTLKKR